MQWFEANICTGPEFKNGCIYIPPTWIQHPEQCIEARKQNPIHVESMIQNIREYGVLDPKIRVLMWEDEAPKLSHLTKDNMVLQITDAKPPKNMYALVGDHTQEAITQLHRWKKRHADYKLVKVQLVTCPKTKENISWALHYGTLDNTIASLHD